MGLVFSLGCRAGRVGSIPMSIGYIITTTPFNRLALMRIVSIILLFLSITSHASSFDTWCNQNPGLADSYVLAMSWQPAFCESYGYKAGKKECLTLTSDSFSSRHMVLHGLWPNQSDCGPNYGFCGVPSQSAHCDYSPLELNDEVAANLSEIMPSYASGSCLERHEWNKHGSCQYLDVNDYFALSIRLGQEADKTEFGAYIRDHRGEKVARSQLREMINRSFGKAYASSVYLGCKQGMLVDLFFQLPALIPQDESLKSLISKAPASRRQDACPATIRISDFALS